MRKPFALIICLLALLLAISTPDRPATLAQDKGEAIEALPELHSLKSKYYDLQFYGTKAEAKETLLLLDTAWPAYKKFFGNAPRINKRELLKVTVHKDKAAMEAHFKKDGITSTDIGGYYAPSTKTAYAYRHPSIQGIREIVLHEAAHQYHYLAKMGNSGNGPTWFREGIAEYLCNHHWDGKTLAMGVVPNFSRKKSYTKAYKTFSAEGFSFEDFLSEKTKVSYPEWAAFTGWMNLGGKKGKNAKLFPKFAKQVENGADAATTFQRYYGKAKKSFPAFLEWLKENQEPWDEVWQEWQATSATGFSGFSDMISIMRMIAPCEEISVTAKAKTPKSSKLGVLISWTDAKNYSMAEVVDDAYLNIRHCKKGMWSNTRGADLPKSKTGERKWEIKFAKGEAIIKVDGTEYRREKVADGSRGLCFQGGVATFTELKATSPKVTKSKKSKSKKKKK